MQRKYEDAIPGTKEFCFFNFFGAYLNQDVESYEEGLSCFEALDSTEEKVLFAEAIAEFLNSKKETDEEKAEFIFQLSSGLIDTSNAIQVLKCLENKFKNKS